jgi:catechol 2,3-dioxygenase-like lactoylglutathione lyase family enzyme
MPAESVIPGLPCRNLDDVLPFYTALGFDVTYRQQRPNPYAAVRRGGIELHFFAVPEFDPAESMGTVIVLVRTREPCTRRSPPGCAPRSGRCRSPGSRG